MAIRRRCNGGTCKSSRRCLEHLWFDLMYRGSRFRMPVNEFAVPRMEPGKQRPVESLEEARDWERLFIGEIKAGRDPRRPRTQRKSSDAAPTDVAGFLDAYVERCVKPAALKSVRSICSRISVLKENLGDLPLDSLEEPDDINRFKTDSDYAEDVELATMHRSLETLRAAMNWGMAQTPPLFKKSPFHRFGVRLNKKAETMRDRRLLGEEEKLLLDTALQKMNVRRAPVRRPTAARPDHWGARALLPAGRDAADSEQAGELGHLPDRHSGRDGEGQREPPRSVQPEGATGRHPRNGDRLLEPEAYVFGTETGACQPNIQTAWETLRLLAHGIEPKPGREGAEWNREQLQRIDLRWHDLQARGRQPPAGRRRRHPDHSADARTREHSADAAVPERDRRGAQKGTGGELEKQRPTASTRLGSVRCSTAAKKHDRPARLSHICHTGRL